MEGYIGFYTKLFEGNHIQSFGLIAETDHDTIIDWLYYKVNPQGKKDKSLKNFARAPIVFFEFYRVEMNEPPEQEEESLIKFCQCGNILGIVDIQYDAYYDERKRKRVILRQYYRCGICNAEEDIPMEEPK